MEDFFRDLAAIKYEFEWYFKNGEIRCNIDEFLMCPLTAVAFHRGLVRHLYKTKTYETIGRELGLYKYQQNMIIACSDRLVWKKEYDVALRRRLLDTLGFGGG